MKAIIFCLLLVVPFILASSKDASETIFALWMKKHNKQYESNDVYQQRFQIFKDNLETIKNLNKVGSARYGPTKFADMSPEEFRSTFLGSRNFIKNAHDDSRPVLEIESTGPVPTSFDWRTKNAVTPVYNQEQCGSCWAFSTVETIESQWFLAGNTLVSLSPQQIVDCDQGNGDEGCNGGDTPTAYEYVIKAGGLVPWTDYPYTGEDGTCDFQKSEVAAHISNWTYVTQNKNETQMMVGLYNKGPLSICVDAESWQFYFGGVVSSMCGNNLDHCVQIVGYEDYTTWDGSVKPIWMIRNSWGADWGEDGYIYVERGYNLCGVADEVTLPIV